MQNICFTKVFLVVPVLTSISAGLFADITTPAEYMFNKTFNGDTNLFGFIPSTAFAGLIDNGNPTAANMWSGTFQNTGLATACPTGSIQYETQYESNWGGKLSCICAGAYFFDNMLNTCTPCPNGYNYDTTNGKTDVSQCQIQCTAGTYVETPGVYGYTVLEYLESPGDAYIDTGFVHNSDNVRGEFRVGVGENIASGRNFNMIGYGHGADETADCGRAINIGGYTIYTRSSRATTPSLNFLTHDNQKFYISVSDSNHTLSSLHLSDGTNEYTVYEDSLLYNERP